MAPGSRDVLAFYLGKAGTLKPGLGRHKETLRTRFNKYAVAGRLLGPAQEKGEKMAMFRELQGRGFSLWYRYRGSGVAAGVPEVEMNVWTHVPAATAANTCAVGVTVQAHPIIRPQVQSV